MPFDPSRVNSWKPSMSRSNSSPSNLSNMTNRGSIPTPPITRNNSFGSQNFSRSNSGSSFDSNNRVNGSNINSRTPVTPLTRTTSAPNLEGGRRPLMTPTPLSTPGYNNNSYRPSNVMSRMGSSQISPVQQVQSYYSNNSSSPRRSTGSSSPSSDSSVGFRPSPPTTPRVLGNTFMNRIDNMESKRPPLRNNLPNLRQTKRSV